MKFIQEPREDNDLSELLCDVCDIKSLPDFKEPEDQSGRLSYSISGRAFAKDKSGGEYILLQDYSIGYWGSEGQIGRISWQHTQEYRFAV